MEASATFWFDFLTKQAPLIVVLGFGVYCMYKYFTAVIKQMNADFAKLLDRKDGIIEAKETEIKALYVEVRDLTIKCLEAFNRNTDAVQRNTEAVKQRN